MGLSKLGRFEILREIGQGAMGQVFLANDPKIERQVAIKTIVLPPGTSTEEAQETSRRFLREAQAAGKLLHPNIVTIFDVGEEAGVSFIAMEFIEGETLEKYTRPAHLLPLSRVLELVEQAAEGLDYAHEHKVIHRDVKPANLMVLKDGTLKITDFGLAKNPQANLTQAGVLLGTPSYMSPEQIQGRELDGRSDLFSLGVVLYEMLTGVRPFEGESISTIIYRVLYEDPRPPAAHNPALPPEINLVLERALAKDPEGRYASGAELAGDLRKALAALPPGTLSRPLPRAGRMAATARAPVHDRTLRRDRRGRPEAGAGAGRARGPAGQAEARPVLLAHQPIKIAAVVLLAVGGSILFPRFVNRQEARNAPDGSALAGGGAVTGEGAPGRAGPGGLREEDLHVTPAGLGSMPPAATGAAGAAGATGSGGPSAGGPLTAGGQVAIDVETIPHGATVALDTIPLAEPKVVLSLSDPKPHDIVAQAGCRQAVAAMSAADLASFKGSLVMELKPRVEDVLVGSEPAGARILVDGHDTGKVTPAAVTIHGCDPRTIALTHEGYRTWSHDYDADDDFDAMVAALKKVALEVIPTGSIVVRKPKDYDVEVYSGDRRLGKGGDTLTLPEGKYTLSFRNEQMFVRETTQVTVEGGRTTTPLINFPLLGTLTVQAQPSNCKVYVDDRYVDVTPILALPIASGGHRVKVVFVPNGATQEVPVAVDGGKDARVVVRF